MDDFEKEIKVEFLNEASTLLEDAEQSFLLLEKGDQGSINKIFRLAHNLKGSSKAVGFDQISEFTHHWESLLLKVKDGQVAIEKNLVSLLLACLDHVRNMIETLRINMDATFDSKALLEQMEKVNVAPAERKDELSVEDILGEALASEADEPAEALPGAIPELKSVSKDLVEVIDVAELNFAPTEEERKVMDAPAMKPVDPSASPVGKRALANDSIRVSLARLEKLIDYVGEMVILQSVLREQAETDDTDLVRKTLGQLGKVSKEIQDISMGLRMLPIKPTFAKMQRIVRDAATSLGKDIRFEMAGEDTEVDKTVLEFIADPLVHLMRNSVDHGIEEASARKKRGKPAQGLIRLTASQQAGKMVIEVSDDGGGLDPEKIYQKAKEKGLVKEGTPLSDRDKVNLIFAQGFSTKDVITDLSGRGVGMDVVKTNIEQVGGEIAIESSVGNGSTFRIILPLSLAILECTVVRSGFERYVIPSYHITESLRADASNLKNTVLGEVMLLRGENLPVLRLRDLLRSKGESETHDLIALIVRSGNTPFALLIDDILGQFQIVTKPLSPELKNLRGIVGSTILGDGRPALILEVSQFAGAWGNKPSSQEARGVA